METCKATNGKFCKRRELIFGHTIRVLVHWEYCISFKSIVLYMHTYMYMYVSASRADYVHPRCMPKVHGRLMDTQRGMLCHLFTVCAKYSHGLGDLSTDLDVYHMMRTLGDSSRIVQLGDIARLSQ